MQEADYNQSQVHLEVVHLYNIIHVHSNQLKQETQNCTRQRIWVSLPQISPILRSKVQSLQQVL